MIILPHEKYPYKAISGELQKKPNGDCIYLEDGCSIYKNRPEMCQVYSCIGFWDVAIKRNYKFVLNNKEFKQIVKDAKKLNNEPH